jgi:hypothetical protein
MFGAMRRDGSLHVWFGLDQGELRVIGVVLVTSDESREVVVVSGQVCFAVQHVRKIHYLPKGYVMVKSTQLFQKTNNDWGKRYCATSPRLQKKTIACLWNRGRERMQLNGNGLIGFRYQDSTKESPKFASGYGRSSQLGAIPVYSIESERVKQDNGGRCRRLTKTMTQMPASKFSRDRRG